MMEMSARDFELPILSSQLEQVTNIKADIELAQLSSIEVLEAFKEHIIFLRTDARLTELILLVYKTKLKPQDGRFKSCNQSLTKEIQQLLKWKI